MDPYHVIVRPIVTEKSTHQSRSGSERRGGAYTFEVHPEANKTQIKDAVEKIYNVRVMQVRTANRLGKLRRYRLHYGRTRGVKKAVIVVDPNSAIELF
jgi:large subunit ribosomal protein L23